MEVYDHFKKIEQKEKYDEQNSLSLALACHLAYQNMETISYVVGKWGYDFIGYKSFHKDPDIDTQCYIMSDIDNIIIVFRGSDKWDDWFCDFQAVYDPGPLEKTKAHEGFQDALFPSVITLTNLIDSADYKNKKYG